MVANIVCSKHAIYTCINTNTIAHTHSRSTSNLFIWIDLGWKTSFSRANYLLISFFPVAFLSAAHLIHTWLRFPFSLGIYSIYSCARVIEANCILSTGWKRQNGRHTIRLEKRNQVNTMIRCQKAIQSDGYELMKPFKPCTSISIIIS